MYQRDYILRIIESLGRVLTRIRQRLAGGEITAETLRGELHDVAQQAGLDYELARAINIEMLGMLVAPAGLVEPGRAWLLAELLYLDAQDARARQQDEEAVSLLEKARHLFEILRENPIDVPGFPGADARIAEIDAFLTDR